jgi:hypothetical protein
MLEPPPHSAWTMGRSRDPSKNGSPFLHPLSGIELRALRRLKRDPEPPSPFVFTSERGSPFTTAGWRKMVGVKGAARCPVPAAPNARSSRLGRTGRASVIPRTSGLYFRAREEIILSSSCNPHSLIWQIDRAYGRNIINDVDFIEPDKGGCRAVCCRGRPCSLTAWQPASASEW